MNYFDYINTLSPNERKKRIEILQQIGVAPATNDGFFTEFGQGFAKGAISAVRGMAKTAEEFGISPAEKITEWADETLANNRQWDEHQDYSPLSLNLGNIGRTLGQGVASTASVIPSAVAGTLIGGPVGTAVGAVGAGATIFAQSYGDNVDEYRKKFKGKYNDDEIRAIAGAQTLVDTGIETLLGSVPMLGKISKNIIGTATKSAFKETVKKYGKGTATRIFTEMGKGAVGEGAEEVLQYFNEKAFHYLAGDKNLDVSAKEALERFAGGAWAGGLFGGLSGVTSKSVELENPNKMETEKHFAKVDNPSNVESLERVAEGLKVHEDIEEVIPRTKSAKMLQQLGKELGMTVNFFTPLKNQDTFFNGAYDTESDIVWINAEKSARDPRFTLGHEFYHFLERSNPELAKTFKGLVDSNLQESEALNLEKELIGQAYQGEDIAPELTADRLGELFIDGEFWQKFTQAEPSFTKTLLDYINHFIEKVKLVFGKNPNAVNFIKNLEEFKQKSIDEVLVPYLKGVGIDYSNLGHIDLLPSQKQEIIEKNKPNVDWERFQDEYVNEKDVKEPVTENNIVGQIDITPSMRKQIDKASRIDMSKVDVDKIKYEAEHGKQEKTLNKAETEVKEVKLEKVEKTKKAEEKDDDFPIKVDVDKLQIDPERFQFKENKDKKGVVTPLQGEFDQQTARPLFVWEDKDGNQFVVEGHHRLDLAKRTGAKKVLAYVHKESKTKTAEWARRRGVIFNIRDNKGSVRDFAEFFREDDITEDEARAKGLFRDDENGYMGFAIGRSSDILYNAFRNDDISAEKAFAIADVAKGDEKLESVGVAYASNKDKHQLKEFLKLLKKFPPKQVEEDFVGDLFGFDDSALQEADLVSAAALKHIKELKDLINKSKGSVKNPELVKQVGVSSGKKSKDKLKALQKKLFEYENYFTNEKIYRELLIEVGLLDKEILDPKVKYSRYRQVNPLIQYVSPGAYKYHEDYINRYSPSRKSNKKLEEDSARKIADLGGIDKALKVALDGDLSTISDTNIYVYKTLLSSKEWNKLSKEEKDKLADQYHNALGSEAGRALAARRLGNFDYNNLQSVIAHINAFLAKAKNPEEIIERVKEETGVDLDKVLVMPTDSETSTPVPETETETTSSEKPTEKPSEKPTEKETEKENVKPKPKNPLQDPKVLNQTLESMLAASKSFHDKSYEFWINSILSGITSPVVNTLGNTTNIAYDLIAKRAVEATLNKVIFHRKDLATFAEFKQMSKAINWRGALERAIFNWKHEALASDNKLDRVHVAIGGKLGKTIRIPTRILAFADEFAKGIVEPIEATSFAFRQGRLQGLKGQALEKYIAEQLKDVDSSSSVYGRERALDLAFQKETGKALSYLIALKNSNTFAGLITRYFLPFVKGPANIIKKGARVTPLGAFNVAKDMFQIAVGKKDFDSKSLGLVAEQIIAWGSIMGLMSLMGDDDEYPLITGSQGALSATGRTFMRDKIPPYSIRIGGTYYSYKRLDPFATSLALIADGIANFQALKNGVKGEEVIKNLVGSVRSQFVDKSFFNAFNQLYQTLSTEGYAIKWGANFASSWMPNVVRQTAGYFDDNIRSSSNTAKGREWYENFFYMLVDKAGLLHGAPKIDYLGREIKKDSVEASAPLGIMSRILALNPQSPDDNMGQVDRLLFNYAKKNPETAFYPDVPSYFFRHKGKMIYFTGDNYNQYAKESGQIANRQIQNAIRHGLLNVNNPTNEDIKIIRGIFQRARSEVKARLIKENKFSF